MKAWSPGSGKVSADAGHAGLSHSTRMEKGALRTRSWRQAAPYPSRALRASSVGREASSRWAPSDEDSLRIAILPAGDGSAVRARPRAFPRVGADGAPGDRPDRVP